MAYGDYGMIGAVSSNPRMVTVTEYGTLYGVFYGSCKVYLITPTGACVSVTVTVTREPDQVPFKQEKYKLRTGKSMNLKDELLFSPDGADSKLTWSVDDEKYADIDKNGVLTAKKKKGTVTVTVRTANGLEAKVKIKIK